MIQSVFYLFSFNGERKGKDYDSINPESAPTVDQCCKSVTVGGHSNIIIFYTQKHTLFSILYTILFHSTLPYSNLFKFHIFIPFLISSCLNHIQRNYFPFLWTIRRYSQSSSIVGEDRSRKMNFQSNQYQDKCVFDFNTKSSQQLLCSLNKQVFQISIQNPMKIFSPKIIRKDKTSTKIDSSIAKILNSPKGPKLRSRKIFYQQQQPLSQSQQQAQPDLQGQKKQNEKNHQQIAPNTQLKHNQKSLPQNLLFKQNQYYEDQLDNNPFNSDSEEQNQNNLMTSNRRKKRQCRPYPLKKIIQANQFKKVQQIDFILYFRILTKAKMFSTLLINQFGQVIFADRLGSQHFQGSLNNFGRNPIYSMILQSKLTEFFHKLQSFNEKELLVLKLLIYSKNSKRRYSKASNEISLTNQDLFNRYLKCLSCQIKPIQITLSSTQQLEGFWNPSLFQINRPLKCFLLKSRLSKTLPQLDELNLVQDKKIEKFIKYTRKKRAQKDVKLQEQIEEDFFPQSKSEKKNFREYLQSSVLNEKDIENIYSQMNDEVKHSKSNLTRGYILNSGEGKQHNNFQ